MSQEPEKTVATIPFHWAVSILVALALPLSFFLGKFNFPLWICFIAWAEYFAFGAKPSAFKTILPCWLYGAVISALWLATAVAFDNFLSTFWATVLANFIWVTILVYCMKWGGLQAGSLAVFGGFTMFLAVYFTKSIPQVGPVTNAYWVVASACIWTIIMGYIGAFFGWFNLFITFPRKVAKS